MSENTAPPRIGDTAPDFSAATTISESMKFSEWQGDSWVVLFSHPADFTPVCSTELSEFARRAGDFEAVKTKLIGLSLDNVDSHLAWIKEMNERLGVEIAYPIIADTDSKVASLYGMVHPGLNPTLAVRSVFIIDPQRVIRAMFFYPMNVGRSVDEVLRTASALQTAETLSCSTPVNWKPGDQLIIPPPMTVKDVFKRTADYDIRELYLSLGNAPKKDEPASGS